MQFRKTVFIVVHRPLNLIMILSTQHGTWNDTTIKTVMLSTRYAVFISFKSVFLGRFARVKPSRMRGGRAGGDVDIVNRTMIFNFKETCLYLFQLCLILSKEKIINIH